MNKENLLFGIIGLLLGTIVGFVFANSVNQNAAGNPSAGVTQNSNLPPGHPGVAGKSISPEQQAAIEKAKQEPNDFEAQLKAAEIYYQVEQYDSAIEFLKKANQLQPENYEVLVNLGNTAFDSSQFAEAEKWYSAAIAKKPDDVNVRTDLGLTFIFREPANYDRAVQEFQRSLETNPDHLQTLQNLTVAYTKKGNAAEAKRILSRFEALDAKNSAIPKLREDIQKLERK